MINNFRTLRKQSGYSQEALASKMMVSISTIRKWENKERIPTFDEISALSSLFGVNSNILLNFFAPEKTKLSDSMEYESKMYRLLHEEIFLNCTDSVRFMQFCHLCQITHTKGILVYQNDVFFFSDVIAQQSGICAILKDKNNNIIVFTHANIISVKPVSDSFDNFTFEILSACPVMGEHSEKEQLIRVTFLTH